MRRARIVLGTALVVCGVLSAGCSSGGAASTAESSPGSPTSSAAASASASSPSATGGAPSPSTSGRAAPPPAETAKPSVAVSTAPPVPVGASATLRSGVLVSVSAPRPVSVTGQGPGEVSGPGIVVTVRVQNSTSGAFDLDGIAVNASYGPGGRTPASGSDSSPAKPLQGSLSAGGSASGSYVFMLPASARSSVRVDVSSSSAARIVVFRS